MYKLKITNLALYNFNNYILSLHWWEDLFYNYIDMSFKLWYNGEN